MPGEIERKASAGPSRTIFTGMRCTTLMKLPVAFSGGSRAKSAPRIMFDRAARSCRPAPSCWLSFHPLKAIYVSIDGFIWKGIDVNANPLSRTHMLKLRFLEVGDAGRAEWPSWLQWQTVFG
jgi:hypothetical protein